MDRITIRLPDDVSGRLSQAASQAGVSRARWVRELIVDRLAFLDGRRDAGHLEARLAALERQVFGSPRR